MGFVSPASRMPEIMVDHCGYSNENHFAARTYWLFNMKNWRDLPGGAAGVERVDSGSNAGIDPSSQKLSKNSSNDLMRKQ